MNLFEEPEWGSSQVISYDTSKFKVSSLVLESSLQRTNNNNGKKEHQKKRKLMQEPTVADGSKKKKKNAVKGSSQEGISDFKDGSFSPKNKGEKIENISEYNKINNSECSPEKQKKVKKKLSKRNKYKELNIKQNAKKLKSLQSSGSDLDHTSGTIEEENVASCNSLKTHAADKSSVSRAQKKKKFSETSSKGNAVLDDYENSISKMKNLSKEESGQKKVLQKKTKISQICLSDNDLSSNLLDDTESDTLKQEVEGYMKDLNFDKLKNGNTYTSNLCSDSESEYIGNVSDSEEEYIEPSSSINSASSCKSSNKEKKDLNSANHSGEPLPSLSTKQDRHITNVKESRKFDKKVLHDMLLNEEKNPKPSTGTSTLSAAEALRQKMTAQLSGARFRYLNEQMYTTTSTEASKTFKSDPSSFTAYHSGFQSQVALWPVNPLDVIISWLEKKPKHLVIADFGCGEAKLAASVPQKTVHSFDLVALNSRVTACDMAHTPLQSESVDVVIFCLALMGTNIKEFILEANRVLKKGGIMKIAEVESRFLDTNLFMKHIKKFGFQSVHSDISTKYFYTFEFRKYCKSKQKEVPNIMLKPCVYKKR